MLKSSPNLVDPVQIVSNLDVDSGHVSFTAANTPGHNSNDLPASVTFANQWTTAIALAGILAFLATGTDEPWIQGVAVAQTGLAELVLALLMVDDRDIDFLEDVLVLAVVTEGILTPTGRPAALSREVGEFVRQTGWRNVRSVGKVCGAIHLQNGQIVVQRSGVVLGVDLYGDDVPFDVWVEFNVVVYVPFAKAHTEIEAVVAVFGERS